MVRKEADMGRIRNFQRRAIESLVKWEETINADVDWDGVKLLSGERLYVLGISDGVGTCSDVHGLYVLVLGLKPPKDGKPYILPGEKIEDCSYAVLLRELTEEEWKEEREARKVDNISLACVELLEQLQIGRKQAVFDGTGKKECYVALA